MEEKMSKEKEEEKKLAKNFMVYVSIVALALGTIAGFIEKDNPFQVATIVVVSLVMIAFFAMKYIFRKKDENKNQPKQNK